MTANVMQSAATWLGQKLQGPAGGRVAGRSITYCRGPLASAEIIAWVAQRDYELSGDESFLTSVAFFDWSLFAAELIITGETLYPRAGDRIKETLNGYDITYELMPIDRRDCVERLDTSGILLLLHTKEVSRKLTT